MAIITTGNNFGATAAVTSTTLNNIANAATFDDPVDGTSLELKVDGKLGIKDAGVTFAKLTDVIDSDTMTGATDTTLATSESIKAYVDGEITSNGITQTTGTAPYYGCRAWAFYNQVTDTVEASGNIASIVRTATGYSTITFTEPMPSAFYSISITGDGTVNVQHTVGFISGAPTASEFKIGFYNTANSGNVANNSRIGISVFA
tara:strand:+ start:25 stop:636 length:612 start_codon:yes stop_codon:yes gene_type:complete